jgi:hypothetical protein
MALAVQRAISETPSSGDVMAKRFDLSHAALRAPGILDPEHYGRRVRWLAVVHVSLFVASLVGFVLLIWRGEFFVTLSQRSNVETLTIAFFLLFFGYFSVITAHGALGGVRIGIYHLRARLGRDRARVEADKAAALGPRGPGAAAAFDRAIELDGKPGEPWEIALGDGHGSLGRIRVSGVRLEHLDAFRGGSNSLLGYFEGKLAQITGADISIVQWKSTACEAMLQYAATADAVRSLGRALDKPVWPTLVLGAEQRQTLERELCALCPALRDEAFLPDWEYEGEHKLPIIPEPLGIISLSRSERRVDPLSSLSAALVIVVVVVALICFFLARPPWVPGR